MITFLDYANYAKDKQLVFKTDNSPVSIVLKVNSSNIANALLELDDSIVAYDFQPSDFDTDAKALNTLLVGTITKPVIYKVDLSKTACSNITYSFLQNLIAKMSSSIRLVFKCPSEYADLGTVLTISQTYANTHFCGGNFLAHPIGRFGCITQMDLNLYQDAQPPVLYTGCCISDKLIDSHSPLLSYLDKTTQPIHKSKTKNATTLFSLSKTGLGAF